MDTWYHGKVRISCMRGKAELIGTEIWRILYLRWHLLRAWMAKTRRLVELIGKWLGEGCPGTSMGNGRKIALATMKGRKPAVEFSQANYYALKFKRKERYLRARTFQAGVDDMHAAWLHSGIGLVNNWRGEGEVFAGTNLREPFFFGIKPHFGHESTTERSKYCFGVLAMIGQSDLEIWYRQSEAYATKFFSGYKISVCCPQF